MSEIQIRFPSGASEPQVKKDAKKLKKENPDMTHTEALEAAAKRHGAVNGYRDYITKMRKL